MSNPELPTTEDDKAEALQLDVENKIVELEATEDEVTGMPRENDADDNTVISTAENSEHALEKESSNPTMDAENVSASDVKEVVPEDTSVEEPEGENVDDKQAASEDLPKEPKFEATENESADTSFDTKYSKIVQNDDVSFKYEVESTHQSLQGVEAHPLDELTDAQVIDVVNEVEAEDRHLELENILFENFLKENDPSLLEGIDEIMAYLLKRAALLDIASKESPIEERPSFTMERQKLKLDSYTSITSIAEGKGPKINLSQKTDMVMRAMEENQAGLETFLKRSHIIKRNLRSELEEFSIREAEILEAAEIFEYNVVTQGFDTLTQRIPAEKFIRYMEEWLKSAQLQIEKLRLRIATLKVQYKKVSQQLIQRQELGENVHAVDFDQLEIENKHFIEKIEQKNIHLIELKKMNGCANLVLSTHKKFLMKQQDDCNKLKEQIKSKTRKITSAEAECNYAEQELNEVYEKYNQCKNLKNQYTVPEVMEYVRLKSKMYDLKKNIKIWFRRRKIQDIAMNTCLREMKNLTGCDNIDPSWFADTHTIKSEDSSSGSSLL